MLQQAQRVPSDTATQTRVYLRLLYSARFGLRMQRALERRRAFSSASLSFVRSVDFQQLAAEQQARIRNLSFTLRAACPNLAQSVAELPFRELVAEYAESSLFWQAWGRSLGENFCLFVHRKYVREGQALRAEVARLDGVASGIASGRTQLSPWLKHYGLMHEQGPTTESYSSPFCPVTAEGKLHEGTQQAVGIYTIRVSIEGTHLRTEIAAC